MLPIPVLAGPTTVAVAATVATIGVLFFGLMGLWIYYTYWKYCKSISRQAVYASNIPTEREKDNIPDQTSESSDISSTVDSEPSSPIQDDSIAPHMILYGESV
jgi:hypothetical protein